MDGGFSPMRRGYAKLQRSKAVSGSVLNSSTKALGC